MKTLNLDEWVMCYCHLEIAHEVTVYSDARHTAWYRLMGKTNKQERKTILSGCSLLTFFFCGDKIVALVRWKSDHGQTSRSSSTARIVCGVIFTKIVGQHFLHFGLFARLWHMPCTTPFQCQKLSLKWTRFLFISWHFEKLVL